MGVSSDLVLSQGGTQISLIDREALISFLCSHGIGLLGNPVSTDPRRLLKVQTSRCIYWKG